MKRPPLQHAATTHSRSDTQDPDAWRHLPAGVAQLDADYRLMRANALARQYLTILGATAIDESIVAIGNTPIQALLAPRPDGLPHEVTTVDAPHRMFTIRAVALPATDAGPWALLMQDVTAERRLQSQQAQQERWVAMQRLVAGTANEFNRILGGMLGYVELLQTQELHAQTHQENLAALAEWGHGGLQLVRHMLDFSGQSVSQLRPRDMRLVLSQLLPHLQRTLPGAIRMVLESAPGAYVINLDIALLLQMLLHLTLNARDAMPDGGELRFSLSHAMVTQEAPPRPDMRPGAWVRLNVADTGKGMPLETQSRLFDPFFTTQTGVRMGLGLTQLYGMMKQHNGYVAVESEVGQGSVFSLYFPSRSAAANVVLRATQAEAPPGRQETLLVVNRNFSHREALRLTLRYLDYGVLTAADGREALELCGAHADAIALVVSAFDPMAPGGWEWVRALRRRHPHVKVIGLLEALHWPARHGLLAQGVSTCLPQPPDLPLLAQAVRQALVANI